MKRLNLRLLRVVRHHKGQFIAVTAVVIIGLMTYTAMNMAMENLETTVNQYYAETNAADIYVELVRIPENALEKIESYSYIDQVEGRIVYDVPLKVNDSSEKVKVRIVSQEKLEKNINNPYLVDGKYITDKNKDVMTIELFAEARGIQPGDVVKPQILGKTYSLNVSGIMATPEYVYLMEDEQTLLPDVSKFGVLMVSNEFAQSSFGLEKSFNELIITVKEGVNLDNAINELEKKLKKYGVRRIYSRKDQLSNRMVTEEINGYKKTNKVVPLIFLSVAAVIISVMIHRMVKNDRTTIGVFKALGFTNRQILWHYTKFSLLIGFIGSVFGIGFGIWLAKSIANMYRGFFNIPMLYGHIYYKYTVTATLISVFYCVLAGLWGARAVVGTMPAESMHQEAPQIGKRLLLEKVSFFWKRLSFSWKMVVRNIFRTKKRVLFLTFGIALTYAIIIIPIFSLSAFSDLFEVHYGKFQKMDYKITFYEPQNENVIYELTELEDMEAIEPIVEFPFDIIKGWRNKVVNVVGVKSNTVFYDFENADGDHIKLPEKGVVMTEGLARLLDVKRGDLVTLKSFIPDRDDQVVVVKDVIKQRLGINVYMDLETMQHVLLDAKLSTGVLINADQDIKPALQDVKQITSIQSTTDLRNVFKQFLSLTYASIGFQLFFSGILGFAIVYNTTIMSIHERQLEFSSLRVMGFGKREIFWLILKENAVMTIVGLLMGVPLGQWFIKSMESLFQTELYSFESTMSMEDFMAAGFISLIFILLAQLATYGKIHRLDFIDALKNRIS